MSALACYRCRRPGGLFCQGCLYRQAYELRRGFLIAVQLDDVRDTRRKQK